MRCAAGAEIEHNRAGLAKNWASNTAPIFSAHLQMLRDPRLRTEIDTMIRERHYSPEYAVSRVLRRYAKVFQIARERLSCRARQRHLRHRKTRSCATCSAAAAKSSPQIDLARHRAGPQPHPQRNRQSQPRLRASALPPRSAGQAATPPSSPKGSKFPPSSAPGYFSPTSPAAIWSSSTAIRGSSFSSPTKRRSPATGTRSKKIATARRVCKSLRELPAETADGAAGRACSATSNSRTRSTTASIAAPTASACTAPSSCTWGPSSEPDEEAHYQAYSR